MFSNFLKKKLDEGQISSIFIHGIFDVIDRGFTPVCECINEDPCFVASPGVDAKAVDEFALIVIAANIVEMERLFVGHTGTRTIQLIYEKLAAAYTMEVLEMRQILQEYKRFMKRVNLPSKTTLYAMSKAVFHKYELNQYQDDYFKRMNAPNPVFLKRLDELLHHFLWNWETFFKKYRY
jgi:stalled ribosome rescue protein Dom34